MAILERAGGIEALGTEVAEDAAATKIVRAAMLANAFGWSVPLSAAGFCAIWYGSEMSTAIAAAWHVSPLHPLYGFVRDLMMPTRFIGALCGNDFVWRGNAMQVERTQARQMARLRPHMQEHAAVSRRRLRALRARPS